MKNLRNSLACLALLSCAAACSDANPLTAPDAPRFDGGGMQGSGNIVAPADGGGTQGSGGVASTEEGVGTKGGGNITSTTDEEARSESVGPPPEERGPLTGSGG
jgi:hypothetical protein